jgi:hypothetical protein
MNKVTNVLYDFDKTWIIVADRKLSDPEKTNAVRRLAALNEGKAFSFAMNKNVFFDLNAMIPLSETDYNSRVLP